MLGDEECALFDTEVEDDAGADDGPIFFMLTRFDECSASIKLSEPLLVRSCHVTWSMEGFDAV